MLFRSALRRLRLGDAQVLRVENPLSEDQSVMRPLILPGLLDAAQHNAAHGRAGVRLFESAHVYLPGGPLGPLEKRAETPAREPRHICVLLTEAAPGGWRTAARAADFYAAKGLLEGLMQAASVDWRTQEGAPAFLHPGRAASIVAGDEIELGWLGELHPLVPREWELDGPVAAFELDVDALLELAPEASTYRDVTSFPAVLQDIAVIVPEDVPAAQLADVVRAGAGELLTSLGVFDLYHGEQVGEGHKSLALRLEFRAPDRTLTDEEVAGRRGAIERELESIGGRLRA